MPPLDPEPEPAGRFDDETAQLIPATRDVPEGHGFPAKTLRGSFEHASVYPSGRGWRLRSCLVDDSRDHGLEPTLVDREGSGGRCAELDFE
jgi:hypothetical protein